MSSRRLLVLQPQFSLTGSARLLSSLVRTRSGQVAESWETEIWVELHGKLDQETEACVPLHHLMPRWAHESGWFNRAAMRFWWMPIVRPWLLRKLARASRRADLVLANTVANVPALEALEPDVPLVIFVHEMELAIMRLLTRSQAEWLFRRASGFIASSEAAAGDLVRWHGIERNKIAVIHPWLCHHGITTGQQPILPGDGEHRAAARQQLGLPVAGCVVLGCGYRDWVKGPDLFIDAVQELMRDKDFANARFVWVGRKSDVETSKFLQGYARHCGVDHRITFLDETRQLDQWIVAADVLALTSRVESFGMVALEAACAGLPVAYFRAAAGPAEFLVPPLGSASAEVSGTGMAAAIRTALVAAADQNAMHNAARDLASRHGEARQVERVWTELSKFARR